MALRKGSFDSEPVTYIEKGKITEMMYVLESCDSSNQSGT